MKFTIKFVPLSEADGSADDAQQPRTIDSIDPGLLAALPIAGDTVLLLHRQTPDSPVGLGSFFVEGRAFAYLSTGVQVSVVIRFTGMVAPEPSTEAG